MLCAAEASAFRPPSDPIQFASPPTCCDSPDRNDSERGGKRGGKELDEGRAWALWATQNPYGHWVSGPGPHGAEGPRRGVVRPLLYSLAVGLGYGSSQTSSNGLPGLCWSGCKASKRVASSFFPVLGVVPATAPSSVHNGAPDPSDSRSARRPSPAERGPLFGCRKHPVNRHRAGRKSVHPTAPPNRFPSAAGSGAFRSAHAPLPFFAGTSPLR